MSFANAASALPFRPLRFSQDVVSRQPRFRGEDSEAYTYYSPEQIKGKTLLPEHASVYQQLLDWATQSLATSESGKRCGFPAALEAGTVSFAVCNTVNNYPTDFGRLNTAYQELIQQHFSVLTQANASKLAEKCLILAVPGYTKRLNMFTAMQNMVRCDFLPEVLKRGLLNLGLDPKGPRPSQSSPFPLIAIRYIVPSDRHIIGKMQDPGMALRRFQEVYG